MTRTIALLALLSFSSLLVGQQGWQGDVAKKYPLTLPPFDGIRPVFAQSAKTANSPDIEIYSVTTKLSDLKKALAFYRESLEKQGFKSVKGTSGPTLERNEMLNAERKLTAVVVASKQSAQAMILGVTVMPQGTLK